MDLVWAFPEVVLEGLSEIRFLFRGPSPLRQKTHDAHPPSSPEDCHETPSPGQILQNFSKSLLQKYFSLENDL